jgi:hypothetical protein
MAFRDVRNAAQAEKYMREQLSEGTTLARLVVKRIDFARGGFRIAMPETVDKTEPLDFNSGNLRLAGDEQTALARVIKSFIREPSCTLLMQDSEARISEIRDLPYGKLAIPYSAEVYWRVAGSELAHLSDDQMLDVVHSTSYFPFTAFFYCDGLPLIKTALNDADLQHVTEKLLGIVVGAFDFRSSLIWWRDDLRPFPLVV